MPQFNNTEQNKNFFFCCFLFKKKIHEDKSQATSSLCVSSQKEKQLKLFLSILSPVCVCMCVRKNSFHFYGFSIPLNVPSKLFQFKKHFAFLLHNFVAQASSKTIKKFIFFWQTFLKCFKHFFNSLAQKFLSSNDFFSSLLWYGFCCCCC